MSHKEIPVVVTGVGAITPVGQSGQETWQSLLAGRCGISPVTSFDTSHYRAHLGAEIKAFDPGPTHMGRASQLAVAAARQAVADAGLDASQSPAERLGVVMGTTSGEPVEVMIWMLMIRLKRIRS